MLFQTESGQTVGPIGQGTWYLGEDPDRFDAECSALRAGVEAGMNLIDTAEMYGDGAAEELVGRAIQGLDRDKLFLASKVYPFTLHLLLCSEIRNATLTIDCYSVTKTLFDIDTSFLLDKTSSVSPALPLVLFPGSLS